MGTGLNEQNDERILNLFRYNSVNYSFHHLLGDSDCIKHLTGLILTSHLIDVVLTTQSVGKEKASTKVSRNRKLRPILKSVLGYKVTKKPSLETKVLINQSSETKKPKTRETITNHQQKRNKETGKPRSQRN